MVCIECFDLLDFDLLASSTNKRRTGVGAIWGPLRNGHRPEPKPLVDGRDFMDSVAVQQN